MAAAAVLCLSALPQAAAAPASPLTLDRLPDFSAIAARATPAVVNISALQIYRVERSPFFSDPFFRDFFGRDLPFRMPQEERKTSLGSGVILSPDGIVVTNSHVIEHAQQIVVTTSDKKRFQAQLLGSDSATDIAVLKIDARGLETLAWGDSSAARVGEYVLAIGNPFQLNQTVTMGIISATGRSNVGIVDYEDFIQTDAAINPGNSGGALVNTRADLIGINTAIYSETGGYQGIGFAVPANLARQVVEQIAQHGRVRRGWIGVTKLRDLDPKIALGLSLKDGKGVVVWELLRGSPSDRAGLIPGDILTALNGQPIESAAQLRNLLASAQVGTDITISLSRDGQLKTLRVRVEESPTR
jgi:Do/DeqQ family serine protease